MISILFFFSTTRIGGAETNILKIAQELDKNGYEIHFASLLNDGPLLSMINFNLRSYTEIGDFYKHPMQALLRCKKIYRDYHPDIISNFGLRVELFSRIIFRCLGAKMIVSNIRSIDTDKTKKQIFLDRITSFLVDHWVSNSEAAKSIYHAREKYPLHKISVIYNFIERIDEHNLPKQFNYRIGVLANIRECKGHCDLIPLCLELKRRNIVPHFYLGGIDNMNGKLQKEVAEMHLESHFTYLGYVENKRVFFSNIDIFLLPSYMEGMPTVVLEAMNYGVPVIATTVGGIPEQIEDGENGFLCAPGDIGSFATSILKLHSEILRLKFICNSYKVLDEKFSRKLVIEKWKSVFTV